MKHIPILLIYFRTLLGPINIFVAYQYPNMVWLLLLNTYLALISDFFDGVIARRMGIADIRLRIYDCWADLVFWLCNIASVWMVHQTLIEPYVIFAYFCFGLEPISDIIYFIRFGKEGCSHAYASKIFGLMLVVGFTALYGFSKGGIFIWLPLVIGIISQLDRILIALLLPGRICDIPSFYHAYLLKQGKAIKRNPWFHGETD